MSNDPMAVNLQVLNSWKEVAIYLRRGVRTVQRWEMELGLPVRRPRGKSRSAVIAFKPELDFWLARALKEIISKEIDFVKPSKSPSQGHILHSNTELLVTKTRLLLERSLGLCAQSKHLREQIDRTLILTARLAGSKKPVHSAESFPPKSRHNES
jgi:hypothetical protein